MSNISFQNVTSDFSIFDNLVAYSGGSNYVQQPGQAGIWSWSTAYNNKPLFFGLNLSFDNSGAPTSGLATQFSLDLGQNNPNSPDVFISNLILDLTTLRPIVDGSLNADAQNNLIWNKILAGNDTVDLGSSHTNADIIFAADGRVVTSGTMVGGNDTITGSTGSDFGQIQGDYFGVTSGASVYGGDDTMIIKGFEADGDAHYVSGGFLAGGNDTITVQAGDTIRYVYGEAFAVDDGGILVGGDDTINLAGAVTSVVVGDVDIVSSQVIGGDDIITDGATGTYLYGDVAEVRYGGVLRGGNDTIHGGGGADTIYGDYLSLATGSLLVGGGNDKLYGDAGNDTLYGNEGNDLLDGGADNDALDGGAGADTMIGGMGNDTFYVDNTGDKVIEAAGEGTDTVLTTISYKLAAGVEVEKLALADASTTNTISLTGNEFSQAITGNNGANAIDGKLGNDTLTGGMGNDRFYFTSALSSTNIDKITDFHNASGDNDGISLAKAVFTQVTAASGGALLASQFAAVASGEHYAADDRIIYNTTTGALYYDADGYGGAAAQQFATLTGHPAGITAADFFVV